MRYKIEIYKRTDGKYDARVWSANKNLIMSSSQGYENRVDCEKSIKNFLGAAKAGNVIFTDC